MCFGKIQHQTVQNKLSKFHKAKMRIFATATSGRYTQ